MADHRLITYDELDRIDHTDLEEIVIKRSSMGGFPERVGEPRYFSYLCDQEHGLIEAVGAHLPEMLR